MMSGGKYTPDVYQQILKSYKYGHQYNIKKSKKPTTKKQAYHI